MKIELTNDVLDDLRLLLKYAGRGLCPTPDKCQLGDRCDICKAEAVLQVLDKAQSDSLKSQAELKAATDWGTHQGRVVILHAGVTVYGYRDDSCHEIKLTEIAIVRFHKGTADSSIIHWVDNHIDPHWDIELLESHSQLDGYSSLWIDGQSYFMDTSRVKRCDEYPAVTLVHKVLFSTPQGPDANPFMKAPEEGRMADASQLGNQDDIKAFSDAGFKRNNSGELERFPEGNWGEGISRREVVKSVRIAGTSKSAWVALVEELDPTGKMTYQKDGGGDEEGTIVGAIEWLERNRQECRKLS